jgi:hypothetical protein
MKPCLILLFSCFLCATAYAQPAGLDVSSSMVDVQMDGTIHVLPYQVIGDALGTDPATLPGAGPDDPLSGLNHTNEAVLTGFDGTNLQAQVGTLAGGYSGPGAPGTQTTDSLTWTITTDASGYITVNYTQSVAYATTTVGNLQPTPVTSATSGSINTGVNAWAMVAWVNNMSSQANNGGGDASAAGAGIGQGGVSDGLGGGGGDGGGSVDAGPVQFDNWGPNGDCGG